jgi:hypothetical protein
MPFQPFYELFPDIAQKETRGITILKDVNNALPAGEYCFHEMFCNDYNCDCFRVHFSVSSSNHSNIIATISYGWESYDFYKKWSGEDDPEMIEKMRVPTLNIGSPQSDLSERLIDLFDEVLLRDVVYVDRVKRHYKIFREKINSQPHNKSIVYFKSEKNKKVLGYIIGSTYASFYDNNHPCIIFGSEKSAQDFLKNDPNLTQQFFPIKKIRLEDVNSSFIGFNFDAEAYSRFVKLVSEKSKENMPSSIDEDEVYFIETIRSLPDY